MTDTDALIELLGKATDSDLSDGGRYFSETCNDLTRCGHGDTGEYQHSPDGKLVEWLWNNRHAIIANAREVIALRAEIARLESDYAAVKDKCDDLMRGGALTPITDNKDKGI